MQEEPNWAEKGELEYSQKKYDIASECFRKALRIKPSQKLAMALAASMQKLGKSREAIDVLRGAYDRLLPQGAEKEKAELFWQIAICERELGELETASTHFQAAKDKAIGFMSEKELSRLDADIESLKRTILMKEKPNRSSEYFRQAELMEKQKKYAEAAELYGKSIEEEKKASAFLRRGRCFQACNEHRKAIKDFELSAELRRAAPTKAGMYEVLYFLGKSEQEEGNYARAVEAFTQAADFASKNQDSDSLDIIVQSLELSKARLDVLVIL